MREQILVRLGFLRDALDDDRHAVLRLRERERLDGRGRRHAGDRVAVRARARHAERLGELQLDARRDRVLETMRLFVRVGPVEAEDVGEPPLEETVAAGHDLGHLKAARGQRELLAAPHLHVVAADHAVHGLGDGRRADAHVLRESGADDGLTIPRKIVDRGQVVLDGRAGRRAGL